MSSINLPSTGNLNNLIASLNASAGSAINAFLVSQSASLWNTMNSRITAWMSSNLSYNPSLRVLVCMPDGTVAFDSSSGNNSFANFGSKSINENHNSRLAILMALLSNSGVGLEQKNSTSINTFSSYIAQRVGFSAENSIGCIRVSVSATY
jgi:hypothetical protein